jgi:hypothetical protein
MSARMSPPGPHLNRVAARQLGVMSLSDSFSITPFFIPNTSSHDVSPAKTGADEQSPAPTQSQ